MHITDSLGHVSTLTHTTAGLIALITGAQSSVSRYAYDSHGNRTSVTDPAGNVTTFAYDAGDRPTTITYLLTSAMRTKLTWAVQTYNLRKNAFSKGIFSGDVGNHSCCVCF